MGDVLCSLRKNTYTDDKPENRLLYHVFNHIIGMSITLPNISRKIYSSASIYHSNVKISNILEILSFRFDEWELGENPRDVMFLKCPCNIYKSNKCALCILYDRYFSIEEFQLDDEYIRYIRKNKIKRTYFRETANYLLNYILSQKNDGYFKSWFPEQKKMLYILVKYVADNWNDFAIYDDKYEPKFTLQDFYYTEYVYA